MRAQTREVAGKREGVNTTDRGEGLSSEIEEARVLELGFLEDIFSHSCLFLLS